MGIEGSDLQIPDVVDIHGYIRSERDGQLKAIFQV